MEYAFVHSTTRNPQNFFRTFKKLSLQFFTLAQGEVNDKKSEYFHIATGIFLLYT